MGWSIEKHRTTNIPSRTMHMSCVAGTSLSNSNITFYHSWDPYFMEKKGNTSSQCRIITQARHKGTKLITDYEEHSLIHISPAFFTSKHNTSSVHICFNMCCVPVREQEEGLCKPPELKHNLLKPLQYRDEQNYEMLLKRIQDQEDRKSESSFWHFGDPLNNFHFPFGTGADHNSFLFRERSDRMYSFLRCLLLTLLPREQTFYSV